MPHDLNIVDGVASIAVATGGDKKLEPWHGLGQIVTDKAMTSEQALRLGGLDFTVEKHNLTKVMANDHVVDITKDTGKMSVIRTDTETALGIVSTKYQLIQNREAFAFIDEIVSANQACIHTAGALGKGEDIWFLLKLPEDTVVKDNDIINNYILVHNTHDGSAQFSARITPVRVVCQNTLLTAFTNSSHIVRIKHTKNCQDKIKQAAMLMGIMQNQRRENSVIFGKMAQTPIKHASLTAYFHNILGITSEISTQAEHAIEKMTANFCDTVMGNNGQDVWDAYNAVTQWVDHDRSVKNGVNRWQAATFGTGVAIKEKAFHLATQLCN